MVGRARNGRRTTRCGGISDAPFLRSSEFALLSVMETRSLRPRQRPPLHVSVCQRPAPPSPKSSPWASARGKFPIFKPGFYQNLAEFSSELSQNLSRFLIVPLWLAVRWLSRQHPAQIDIIFDQSVHPTAFLPYKHPTPGRLDTLLRPMIHPVALGRRGSLSGLLGLVNNTSYTIPSYGL